MSRASWGLCVIAILPLESSIGLVESHFLHLERLLEKWSLQFDCLKSFNDDAWECDWIDGQPWITFRASCGLSLTIECRRSRLRLEAPRSVESSERLINERWSLRYGLSQIILFWCSRLRLETVESHDLHFEHLFDYFKSFDRSLLNR